MVVQQFSPIIQHVLSDRDIAEQQSLIRDFFDVVATFRALLESGTVILHGPVSQGKDSTIVELAMLEAYRQCVEAGTIEPQRPMILSTVDTLNESIPMKMYPKYCQRRVVKYAQECGINLYYDTVTPGLNDEYFVKFTGGQKLIPNASRRGDCSIILKVQPSERYVKTQRHRFKNDPDMEKYTHYTVISCVGSRVAEGNRRSKNMTKQGIANKDVAAIFAEMSTIHVDRKMKLLKYAPIKDWSTDDVFNFLRLAGSKPVTRMLDGSKPPLPTFLDNFGLLLELYGNGSNDVCEVAVGQTSQGGGCNGKARYGCWNCTMVASTDHSSTALTKYERWQVLGAENALRVRDYLYRLSCDITARAFHARAIDPTGFNRVALQPNVLKPKYLEKMVRYASQLTVDSRKHAEWFSQLVREGREMEHPGYRDIAEDEMIPPKAKKAFLEMYKECAQEPIFTSFSEAHAILLSFRWSIDGIGAAPYRPLAIWNQTEKGEGRIPYPMLNDEYERRYGKIKMIDASQPLPDALMLRIYKEENAESFARNPLDLYDLWTRPADDSDAVEEDMNCTLVRRAKNHAELAAQVRFHCEFNPHSELHEDGFSVRLVGVDYAKITLDGRTVKPMTAALLKQQGLEQVVTDRFDALISRWSKSAWVAHPHFEDGAARAAFVQDQLAQWQSANGWVKTKAPYLASVPVVEGYQLRARKAEKRQDFTRRVARVNKQGKVEKRNTRLTFYTPSNHSALHAAHVTSKDWLKPVFASEVVKRVTTSQQSTDPSLDEASDNIYLDPELYAAWQSNGGKEEALRIHDAYLKQLISRRHIRKTSWRQLRSYGGAHVAEALLAKGPIMIDSQYWDRLERILRRTQIFDSLGLFIFQSYRYEELVAHPAAIPMVQHRKDKAQVVMHLRRLRNEERRKVRAYLSLGETGREKAAMQQLDNALLQWESAMSAGVKTLQLSWASQWHAYFDTSDVPVSQQASVWSLWMTMQAEHLGAPQTLWQQLLSATQLEPLKQSESAQKDAIRLSQCSTAMLLAQLKDLSWQADSFVQAVRKCDGESADAYRSAIASAMESFFPMDEDARRQLSWWRPGLEQAKKQVSERVRQMEQHIALFRKLQDILQSWHMQPVHVAAAKKGASAELQLLLL